MTALSALPKGRAFLVLAVPMQIVFDVCHYRFELATSQLEDKYRNRGEAIHSPKLACQLNELPITELDLTSKHTSSLAS